MWSELPQDRDVVGFPCGPYALLAAMNVFHRPKWESESLAANNNDGGLDDGRDDRSSSTSSSNTAKTLPLRVLFCAGAKCEQKNTGGFCGLRGLFLEAAIPYPEDSAFLYCSAPMRCCCAMVTLP